MRTYGLRRCFEHATGWTTARREENTSRRTCADVTRPCRLWTAVARRGERSGPGDGKLPLQRWRAKYGDGVSP